MLNMKPEARNGFKPVASESRTAFGIVWFKTEIEANEYASFVKKENQQYNGGMYHGMPCGREKVYDFIYEGIKLYAVTES